MFGSRNNPGTQLFFRTSLNFEFLKYSIYLIVLQLDI